MPSLEDRGTHTHSKCLARMVPRRWRARLVMRHGVVGGETWHQAKDARKIARRSSGYVRYAQLFLGRWATGHLLNSLLSTCPVSAPRVPHQDGTRYIIAVVLFRVRVPTELGVSRDPAPSVLMSRSSVTRCEDLRPVMGAIEYR